MSKQKITVQTSINAPVEKVWQYWTDPGHITKWNFASQDWHCPAASNDLRKNGKISLRMEAKDGSAGFDFEGVYSRVEKNKELTYVMADGREVSVLFFPSEETTILKETFEAENIYPPEKQQEGWQAILDNFKIHVENN